MIKSLIRKLFFPTKKRNEIISDEERNSNFRTKEELEKHKTNSVQSDFKIEKGKIQSVTLPELGNQKGFTLTKWYFKSGDIVKRGDIVCEIENENITMEFESIYSGKITPTCKLNQKLIQETEIFTIEGI